MSLDPPDLGERGDALFSPASVALVGASETPGKLGRLLLDNLRRSFGGSIYPVHPSADRILDLKAHRSVRELSGLVDLAVIATPPYATPTVLEDCVAARVKVAVVLSGGFSETGEAGATLESRLGAIAREGGMRLVGPNCFGVIDVGSGLNASLGMGLPSPGGVSLVTQSGAYGMAAFSLSQEGHIGIRRILAPGNKADVDEVDALRWLVADPKTRVIALLLESIEDGEALIQGIRAAGKPVVVLKSGRGPAAQRAAASHTAALANDARVATAALRQAGAHLVRDGLALLDTAAALDLQPPLAGPRVAIITNSGGTGVELTDLLEAEGLEVPALSEQLQRMIRGFLPQAGSAQNPVDVTTDWSRFPMMYGEALRALLACDEVDAVVLVLLQRSALSEAVAERVLAEAETARAAGRKTPVHVCWVAPSEGDPIRRRLTAGGIPCHPWPLRTARALAACLGRPVAAPATSLQTSCARPPTDADGWIDTTHLFAELADAGLPVAPFRFAETAADAMRSAEAIGFPVVLKAIRPGLVHRSKAGAVRLDLGDASAVQNAYVELDKNLGRGPVLVQGQVAAGAEIMIGAKRDACFGMVLLVALGGIWVEALDDIAIRLLPVSADEALMMLDELAGQGVLNGLAGDLGVDRSVLAQLIAEVSRWTVDRPWIAELDLNPVVMSRHSAVIVDARLRAAIESPSET